MHFNSRPHGGRPIFSDNLAFTSSFQLTPSRRATHSPIPHQIHKYISTHALTEGDTEEGTTLNGDGNFNSRPHGGRPERYVLFFSLYEFQLTPSRRATSSSRGHCRSVGISTHALTEGDVVISVSCLLTWNFNSRPHGGRLHTPEDRGAEAVISTHALTEGDTAPARSPGASEHFNSRPHGGRHLLVILVGVYLIHFNSRPHGGRQHEDSLCDRKIRHFNSRPHGGRP